MRKILTLLFLLIPLLGNAQQLYKANAMRFKEGDKLEQWEKCNLKVICVLMSEICEIAESHGESVGSISYFFLNRKSNLMEISDFLSDLVDRCDRI